jgi:glycosyltransferase involved in cell wall biosynthesis
MPLAHGLDLATLVKLVRVIRSQRIDVVLPTKVKEYWLGGIAARYAGAAIAIRLGIVRRLRALSLRDWLLYGVFPDRIIVNASAIKKELLKTPWMRADRIVVIYNGVEPTSVPLNKGALRAEYGIPSATFVAIAVGRLTPRKGFDLLLKGFAIAARAYPQTRLVLVGDGPQRGRLNDLAQALGVQDQVIFAGTRPQPLPLIADADVLVAPSRQEGLPNTILEAWQVGVPVIATDVAGASEVITHGQNGYLVPPEDADALGRCLLEVIGNPGARKRVALAGASSLAQRHTLSRMTDDLERTLQGIAPRPTDPRRAQRVQSVPEA